MNQFNLAADLGRNLSTHLTRRQALVAAGVLAVDLLAACRAATPPPALTIPASTPVSTPAPTPVSTPPAQEAEPDAIDPELRRKLSQMVLIGFRGLTLDEDNPIIADVRDLSIGGVVLFSYDVALFSPMRNIESPAQVAALTAALRKESADPLLVAVDQEGGRVARLDETHGFPATIAPQALGERNDPAFTYAAAAQMAHTLAEAGINHNFAPVVDVNTNPANPAIGALGRSFSGDPAVVTEQAAAFIRAHHDTGVTTTLKHFPGHGSSQDSHLGFVDVSASWQPLELEPYRELIRQGLVDSVMTAHVFNANLDPDAVATLSKPIITGILREELGFDGVVISDDMQMRAIAGAYGFEEAVVSAVEAGIDVIAVGNNLNYRAGVAGEIVDALAAAIEAGRLNEAQIDASYRRITALKQKTAASAAAL